MYQERRRRRRRPRRRRRVGSRRLEEFVQVPISPLCTNSIFRPHIKTCERDSYTRIFLGIVAKEGDGEASSRVAAAPDI
jgi:hypothetical protein